MNNVIEYIFFRVNVLTSVDVGLAKNSWIGRTGGTGQDSNVSLLGSGSTFRLTKNTHKSCIFGLLADLDMIVR